MTNPYLKVLLQYRQSFRPVVPFDPSRERITRLDFTDTNTSLEAAVINDIQRFECYINNALASANAVYGIGGYAEHRTIYSRSKLFDGMAEEEPRRLHLGTDIWGKAGTPVSCPLDATVHSFANNATAGDYGATIILQHELDDIRFYTLYGHLSMSSIDPIREGQVINAGEVFAYFGAHEENGWWPPHLHFQIILDLKGRKGDYPGVCKFSEKETWLSNSPDPDLMLQFNRYISPEY